MALRRLLLTSHGPSLRSRARCRAQSPSGFTLIEILVALSLLAFVILAASRGFLTTLSLTAKGNRLTLASALATRTKTACGGC